VAGCSQSACAIIALAADLSVLPNGSEAMVMVQGLHRVVALSGGLIGLIPAVLLFWWSRRPELRTLSFWILLLSRYRWGRRVLPAASGHHWPHLRPRQRWWRW
jgi:hypothetical protein